MNFRPIQKLRRRISRQLMLRLFGASRRIDSGARPLPLTGIQRILICRISHSLGNTLLVTPLLREIQALYPGAEVDIVTRSPVADDIFGGFFCVHRIYQLPQHGLAHLFKVARILRALRKTHYDLAIDPCIRSQSGRLGILFARATYTLGFSNPKKSGRLSHAIPVPTMPKHVGQLPVYLLRAAIGVPPRHDYPRLDICLSANERQRGLQALTRVAALRSSDLRRQGVIGVFANASGTKRFDADWWAKFLDALEPRCADFKIIEIIPASAHSLLNSRYPGFYSSTPRKLAAVLGGLSQLICADCGIMHLACASGVSTTGIFSVTDADEWGPYGPNDNVIDARDRSPEEVARALRLPGENTALENTEPVPLQLAAKRR